MIKTDRDNINVYDGTFKLALYTLCTISNHSQEIGVLRRLHLFFGNLSLDQGPLILVEPNVGYLSNPCQSLLQVNSHACPVLFLQSTTA
jgi:hypothetical protein